MAGNKWLVMAGGMVLLVLLLAGAQALAGAQGATLLPFRGEFDLGGERYEFEGQAILVGTLTPTATPVPPTDTPTLTPTSTATPTYTPTYTPNPPTPTTTPTPGPLPDLDVGAHGWGFALETMVRHPQDDALISVLIPYQMAEAGYTWADLVAAAGWAGPAESKFDALARAAAQHAGQGANAIIYVPEGLDTSGNVPVFETLDLETYVDRLAVLAQTHGYTAVYGPGLSLVSDLTTWQYGRYYDLDEVRVAGLAARLPAGSLWVLRMFTPELMYGPTAGFRAAVAEYVGAIHAGNPGIRIVLHLSCPAGSEARFLAFVDVSRDLVDMAYMGIDPVRDNEGTLLTMAAILEATGAEPVTPEPPTATPTPSPAPPTPTPAPTVLPNLAYGPDARHVLDLYLPGGAGLHPVVAWFHGGGLSSGDKTMVRQQAAYLQAAGFAVAAANYRLTSQDPPAYLPAQIEDAEAVIAWLRANAAKYGLDPNHIGAAGGSAGAILSTNLGTRGTVQASVGLAGILDFRRYFDVQIDYCDGLPGEPPECLQDGDSQGKGAFFMCYLNQEECLTRVVDSSAYCHISPGDPPSFVAIGELDETPGSVVDHSAYDAELDAAGVDSTLVIVPGAGHGDLWSDIAPQILAFFETHLKREFTP